MKSLPKKIETLFPSDLFWFVSDKDVRGCTLFFAHCVVCLHLLLICLPVIDCLNLDELIQYSIILLVVICSSRSALSSTAVMSDMSKLQEGCDLCGLSFSSSQSENRFALSLSDGERREIFNFLRRRSNANENSTKIQSIDAKEEDGSCTKITLCNLCHKRIKVVSVLRRQVSLKFIPILIKHIPGACSCISR